MGRLAQTLGVTNWLQCCRAIHVEEPLQSLRYSQNQYYVKIIAGLINMAIK